jgi:hypothetical protein
MASESDLKLEIEQLRSELAISEKLESKSRERQLELEAQNAKMKKEFQSLRSQLQGETDMESVVQSLEEEIVELKESQPDAKRFKETSKLVVTLQEENDKLKQELREVTNNSRHGESHFALEYAMTRDEQLKELAKKNFELFNKVNNSKEEVERARQDMNDLATQLYKKKNRVKDLHKSMRSERDRRTKAEAECGRMKEKISALTKHIEKLMVALRLHAQAQAKTNEEKQRKQRQLKKATKKVNLTKNKAFLSSRVIAQLRQQVDMLTGQLRLADDRYAELRTVIDVERRTSQTNIKRMAKTLQRRMQSDEESKGWMMEQQKALQRQQDEVAKRRLRDEKRLQKEKDNLKFIIQEAQEKQLAAEAEAKRVKQQLANSPGKGLYASVPDLRMTTDLGSFAEHDVPLYGSLPTIESASPSPAKAPMSLSEHADIQREEERNDRLALYREQQRQKEKNKSEMYFWRHSKK